MLTDNQLKRFSDLFDEGLKSDRVKKHFEEIKQKEDLKNANIIHMLTNPQELKSIILKLANTEHQYIDNESFAYNQETPLTKEEYNILYDTVESFIGLQGKLYNESDFDEEAYFPTSTGHLIVDNIVLTIQEMYGQGTISGVSIEKTTEDNTFEDIIQTFNDNLIPYTDFETLEQKGLDLFNRRDEIHAKLKTISILEESRDKLMKTMDIKDLNSELVDSILTIRDSITNQIEKIINEI